MASEMNSKERVMNAMKLKKVDRIPVTGCDSNVCFHHMKKYNANWPESFLDSNKMVTQAAAAWLDEGLEAVGLPFDQTTEAEILGCEIKWRENDCPSVPFKGYETVDEVKVPENWLEKGRIPVILKALEIASEKYGDEVAIYGHIVGPYQMASYLGEVQRTIMDCFSAPDRVRGFTEFCADLLPEYANAMFDHGADIVTVEDMIASVDLLGPKFYKEYAAPVDKTVCQKIKGPNILHVCGNTTYVIDEMIGTGCTAISIDSKANMAEFTKKTKGKCAMLGNVDPVKVLFGGTPADVEKDTMRSLQEGADLVAPGCSLSPLTSHENLQAMVDTVKKNGAKFVKK